MELNETIRELDVSQCELDHGAAAVLAEIFRKNGTLQRLVCNRNQRIGDRGISTMAEALKTNQTLTELCLLGSGCGTAGCVALASFAGACLRASDQTGGVAGAGGVDAPGPAGEAGRQAVGVEIDDGYCAAAVARLEQWHAQGRLPLTANATGKRPETRSERTT
jgi:hypothetical protein